MRKIGSAILMAKTDITCEFLLAFIRRHPKANYEKIERHIEIDRAILNEKIDLLKEAKMIDNHTERDENNQVVDRILSLTKEGENALLELGYGFK